MVTSMRIPFFFCLGLALNACAKAPPPLPVAQFQLIDADTMKPIEGGWVNFIWYGKKLTGKVQSRPCVRAVLAKTGADGRFADTAKESFWVPAPLPDIFVPGYEYLQYRYGDPDDQHVTLFVRMDKTEAGRFPAWEESLKKLGYTWKPHEWTKVIPATGFRNANLPDDGRRYFVRYRSFPIDVEMSFRMVGTVCDKPGAENVGLSAESGRTTTFLRASESLKYFCHKDWLTLPADRQTHLAGWIQRSLWLLPDQNEMYDEMQTRFPDFTKQPRWSDFYGGQRPFTAEEQTRFCDWLLPLTKREISHAKN
jgi:hypothetical protein